MNTSLTAKRELTDRPKDQFSLGSLLSTSAGYGFAEILSRLIQFAATFYLARICTKAEFGIFGFLIAVQQAVAVLGQSGILEMLMGEVAHATSDGDKDRIIRTIHDYASWYRLGWFVLASTTLVLYSGADDPLYSVSTLIAVSAGGYFLSLFFLESSVHQILQSRRLAVCFKIVPIILMNISGIIAFQLSGNRLHYFFVGLLAGLVLTLLLTRRWSSHRTTGGYRASHNFIELFRETAPYLIVAILGWLTGYGNNVIIKAVFTAEVVAEYTLALTLAMPVFMISNAINQAWYPKFIELSQSARGKDLNNANAAASAVQLLLAVLVSIALMQIYPALLTLLGGNLKEYAHAVQYAGLLMLGYVSLYLYYRVFLYFLVARDSGRFLVINAIAGVIGIASSILFMIRFGVIGIYSGFILTNVLMGICYSYDAARRWNLPWPAWNLVLAAPALGASIYISDTVRHALPAFLLQGSTALIFCLAWFGLNRKLIWISGASAIRS